VELAVCRGEIGIASQQIREVSAGWIVKIMGWEEMRKEWLGESLRPGGWGQLL
jgi:hypothetical protein